MWLDGEWVDDCKMYDDFPMQDGGSELTDDDWFSALLQEEAEFSKIQ